ncbi:hypothetical protein [Pontibacter sp. HSC-36F09]|uniref:hypothetical protein n=1 Tax=Pontibacter sp. HSC-36F09 TaxID=2910966 RepID=UPI00209F2159|nr:hypothetical protein [Pontibacter sp. HSC-36F09]MCP2042814.1 hypothetical protein [Pontibacter sp. HSC-36F09]
MKLKLILFLLFFPVALYAQIQSQKGAIALKNGDNLTGSITYFYDEPNEIRLSGEQGAKQVFTAEQISEIKLDNGEKFVARRYSTNADSVSLVLKVLIESPKVSLYKREENSSEYYYVSKDNALHKLENNSMYENQGGKKYLRKDHKYIGTLSSLMYDRIDIMQQLEKTTLKEGSLTKIIREYNQGDASYEWQGDKKAGKEPNWVFFTQYSKYGFSKNIPIEARGYGNMAGLQYYFSKHSRHSIKASLDYSSYRFGEENAHSYALGLRYEMAFKKAEKYSAYVLVHLIDAGYVSYSHPEEGYNENGFGAALRLSPGLGFESKLFPRMAVYAEINHLLVLEELPRSFSLGLKYDFGKTNWK